MSIKLEKKVKSKILLSIIIVIAIITLITFGIFDLKISKLIPSWMNENWFSIIFDVFGLIVVTLPAYFLLFLTFLVISFKYIANKKWKIFWYMFFQIFALVTILVTYFSSDLLLISNNPTKIEKIELICSIIYFMLTIFAIIYINIIVFYKKYYKNIYWLINMTKASYYALAFLILTLLSTQLLKIIFGRNRPESVIDYQNDFQYIFQINFSKQRGTSFPSGHTVSSATLLCFSYFFYLKSKKTKIWKYCTSELIWVLIISTAVSRITMHKHFSTDVLFSIYLIIFWYYCSIKIVDAIFRKVKNRHG
ncbi:phosphatase PAP2 family protein [Spiroplasma taiwanense]|uniref:Phosphatidic acid phosphatase type 2/haloperoxidase domain-containing protein n=1 Tax=Spiroplasma taiwanense CT-1 TaxID=1276220 RepID=S5LT69_9MOLU|nr:phosphatase PAP2 family protein [Spiroplasma taiwanense]AGR40889.1 hypothetical protein STAIW_v1c02120 [Spiroplasma taiwanense CT-1]